MSTLLEVNHLQVAFGTGPDREVAVEDVSFSIPKQGTFALLGESGSGKSVTALSVMRLLPEAARIETGEIRLNGRDLLELPEVQMRGIRGGTIGMIFQEPMMSLNPVMTVGQQICEPLRRHRGLSRKASLARALELLDAVRVPEPQRRLYEYPHQLSGGMKQRVMIAGALAAEPELLIADEPTTALDVTIQAQVLELLRELQRDLGMAMLFITHDLAVAKSMADAVAIMQHGRIVEAESAEEFFENPQHEYSRNLFAALPNISKRGLRLHGNGSDSDGQAVEPASRPSTEPLLEVENLRIHFPIRRGVFRRVVGHVRAVDGLSFTLREGETFALVGESGCGKTTTGKSLIRLLPVTQGSVHYRGHDLSHCSAHEMAPFRSELQIVFQDPFSSLNPRMVIGDIIAEGMQVLGVAQDAAERRERIEELLLQVGLRPEHQTRYPHEFSGGQRQRIAIARALAVNPRLIVCDEPTSALDVTIQAQILNLLQDLQDQHGLTYLFITHNIAVVSWMAHRMAVMHEGQIVEQGDTVEILQNPQHEYTRTLLSAVPRL